MNKSILTPACGMQTGVFLSVLERVLGNVLFLNNRRTAAKMIFDRQMKAE